MKWKLLSILTALTLVLVGCGTTNEEGAGDRDPNMEPTNYNDDLNNNRNKDVRNEGRQDGQMGDRQDRNMRNRGDTGENTRNDDRMDRDNRDNDKRDEDRRYDVSEEAANKITDDVSEIDHAYVLTTKNNAYVAAQLDAKDNDKSQRDENRERMGDIDRNQRNDADDNDRAGDRNMGNEARDDDDLTEDVKKEVTDAVKSVDDDIDNVYVSTNPDFVDLTNNYINDMDNGRPVKGFFDQMGDMIERLFPQNR